MTQESSELSLSLEQMSDLYRKEIVAGVDVSAAHDGSDIIKCGFLGEIGSNWPVSGNCSVCKKKIIAVALNKAYFVFRF